MSTTVTITVDGTSATGAAQSASGGTASAGQAPSMEPGADVATSAETDDGFPVLVPQDLGADDSAGDTDAPGEPPDPDVVVDDDLMLTADAAGLGAEPSIEPS